MCCIIVAGWWWHNAEELLLLPVSVSHIAAICDWSKGWDMFIFSRRQDDRLGLGLKLASDFVWCDFVHSAHEFIIYTWIRWHRSAFASKFCAVAKLEAIPYSRKSIFPIDHHHKRDVGKTEVSHFHWGSLPCCSLWGLYTLIEWFLGKKLLFSVMS